MIEIKTVLIRSDGGEALVKVGDDIVDVLGADGKADGRRRDALIEKLLLGQLGVRGGRGMDDEGLDIRNVCKQRENFQMVDEAEGRLLPALDLKGEDARAAVREGPAATDG